MCHLDEMMDLVLGCTSCETKKENRESRWMGCGDGMEKKAAGGCLVVFQFTP